MFFYSKFSLFLKNIIVASEAKRPYKNDENFLNNWLPDHHKLYLIYFYKSWARPGGRGSVQILCYRTPPRPLGISKRHFTGRKMVVWGWFMSIFINLYRLYDPFLFLINIFCLKLASETTVQKNGHFHLALIILFCVISTYLYGVLNNYTLFI